jgi:NAD(P)-dependent dehydrogenase (short-subunit alcohol dehydrogenase family)
MQDKVIVITGASSGIGAALARLVGARGARPVLLARREQELLAVASQSGPHAMAMVTDVTHRDDLKRALDAALARYGHVDAWVNNAGRGISRPPSQLTDEDLDDMMTVNVKSVLYAVQAVLPHFKQRRRGHIINVSSLLGRVPLAPVRSAYAMAKHALNGFTATLRMELRAEFPDIAVSSVHPGVVATDFGLNALHGGIDSRNLPFAQPVDEVAAVIAEVIDRPRADVYTQPHGQKMVVDYFAAPDMTAAEAALTAPRPQK